MLNDDPGFPDGQPVIMIPEIRPASDEEGRKRLLAAPRGLGPGMTKGRKQSLEWNRQQRKVDRPEIEE